MPVVMSPRPQPQTARPDVPEVLFPEARRRRRRRWTIGVAAVALCASAVGLSVAVAAGGSGGRAGPASPGISGGRTPTTPGPAAESGAELAGGTWARLAPPRAGVVKAWDLAVWTGRDVIAWGSTSPCCGSVPGEPTGGSSEHGAALDPASGTWRALPAAPVDVTVEATAAIGRQVLVWGSAPAAAPSGTRNVLLGFDPTTWRWKRLATPPLAARTAAQVFSTGTTLIVIGGQARSTAVLMSGATYDPRTNQWSALPAIPRVAAAPGSKEEPVGVTAAWAAGTLYVWVTRQVSQACGADCGEISAKVQALRWSVGASQWHQGPTPRVPTYDATALSMGSSVALLDGSSCLPEMSCPGRETGSSALLHVSTDRWSSVAANAVLESAESFVSTGDRLVAVSPYLTSGGYLVGGYVAALDPASGSWANLPELPVSAAPPSGPVLSGTVWAGSELIDSGLVLMPGHRSTATVPGPGSTVPSCPPITFPEFVGGQFCGPAPGPGNGHGVGGSCLGTETAPPCGPGMVVGRYYSYTVIGSCTSDYIDGRWWADELPGGSGPLDVWVSVTSPTGAGWIGPDGAVGFEPTTATSCS